MPPPATRRCTISPWISRHPLFAKFLASHVDAVLEESGALPFDGIAALTAATHSAARLAKQAVLVPSGRDSPAWTAHWHLRARMAYGRGDADALRDALRRLPQHAHLFADADGAPNANLSVEVFEAAPRESRAHQASNDMEHDLRHECDAQAKRAIRARAHRRLAALAPQARTVHCVTVLRDDGAAADDSAESAALLARHWQRRASGVVPSLLGDPRRR